LKWWKKEKKMKSDKKNEKMMKSDEKNMKSDNKK
jgi:hypothetical protein